MQKRRHETRENARQRKSGTYIPPLCYFFRSELSVYHLCHHEMNDGAGGAGLGRTRHRISTKKVVDLRNNRIHLIVAPVFD